MAYRNFYKGICVWGLLVFFFPEASARTIIWNRIYDSGHMDNALDIASDGFGFIYVTGFVFDGVQGDYLTMKYNAEGDTMWTRIYDSGDNDIARSVTVDEAGYVYVTGSKGKGEIGDTGDFLTIKYDPSGNLQWDKLYDSQYGKGEHATGVASYGTESIYVTGYSWNGFDWDYLTVKYDSAGEYQWHRIFDSDYSDNPYGVAVDDDGDVYVTGRTGGSDWSNCLTVKYGSLEGELWNEQYASDKMDYGADVAVDGNDFAYVVGNTGFANDSTDYLVIKYDALNGNEIWSKLYDYEFTDLAQAVAVDDSGNIYVTGHCYDGIGYDWLTVEFDPSGSVVWDTVYDSGEDDFAYGIALDDEGSIYVTGYSMVGGGNADVRTIKYGEETNVIERKPESLHSELILSKSFGESVLIRYQLPASSQITLSVYDASGRRISVLLDESRAAGVYEYRWAPENPGVYFIRLEAGRNNEIRKFIAVR